MFMQLEYRPTNGCVFRCQRASPPATMRIELVVAPDGRIVASGLDAPGARREAALAHAECYDAFYRVAYGTPFLT